MAFPIYLRIGSIALHPHLVFETLAYFVGFRLYLWQRRKYGDPVPSHLRWWAISSAAAGGALGSKILYWLETPALTLAKWNDWTYMLGGKTVVGGLLGGLIGVELTKRIVGETRSTGDLFAIPLAAAMAIGRIGCFLTGLSDQTYGLPTRLPWGIDFGDGIPRHPTQLYEILFLTGVIFVLARMRSRLEQSGDLFKAFMILYLAWRLLIDSFKPEVQFAGLGSIRWACVLGLLYYGRDILRIMRRVTQRAPSSDIPQSKVQ